MQLLKKSSDKEVQDAITDINLTRLHNMSFVIIILEVIMIITSFIFDLNSYYRYSYYILLGLVLIFNYFTSSKFRKYKVFEKYLTSLSIYIFSFWGILITLFDLSNGYYPFVYLINISFVVSFYIAKPKENLLYNIINLVLFYVSLFIFGFFSGSVLVNITFFHLVLFIISIDKYNTNIAILTDREELKAANKELSILSTIDPLSGCKNRRGLEYELEKYEKQVVFALLTDIDNFKEINDTYGHDIGDLFIVNFAKILQNNFGLDRVFRIGGDEFFIISNIDTLDVCLKKFDISRREVRSIDFVKNSDLRMTTSTGYTYRVFKSVNDFDELFKELDLALYRSKQKGKNQILNTSDII